MASTLNSDFIDNNEITDIEVHYLKESKEGQTLKIYRHNKENEINFLIKRDSDDIIKANLKSKNKFI